MYCGYTVDRLVGCCMTICVWQLMVYGTPKWTFPATIILLGTFSFVDQCILFFWLCYFPFVVAHIHLFLPNLRFICAVFICRCILFCSLLVFSFSMLTIIPLVLFSVRRVVSHYVRHASDIWCRYCKLPFVFASLVLVRHIVIIMFWKLCQEIMVSPRV